MDGRTSEHGQVTRRYRNAIAHLETVLAKIDVELGMRRPLTDFSNGVLLRTLLAPIRFRSTQQPIGDI